MLYDDQKSPEINIDFSVQNEVSESEFSHLPVGQCQNKVKNDLQVKAVEVVRIDEKVEELLSENKIPASLCAAEAMGFQSEEVYFRPCL